jgi:hypothetical protein
LDWERIGRDLDALGFAVVKGLIDATICADLIESYEDEERFRSHIVMRRHGFGEGEYKYFAYPCRRRSNSFGKQSIRAWCRSPIAGWRRWGRRIAIRNASTSSLPTVTISVSGVRPRCC